MYIKIYTQFRTRTAQQHTPQYSFIISAEAYLSVTVNTTREFLNNLNSVETVNLSLPPSVPALSHIFTFRVLFVPLFLYY